MAKLSRSNSAVFEDGTTVDETKGHIMFHTPHRLYYLVKYDASVGCNILWGSTYPISEHYIDHPTFSAYMASLVGDKLVSRSGLGVANNNQSVSSLLMLATTARTSVYSTMRH